MDAINHQRLAAPPKHIIGLISLLRHRRVIALSGALFLSLGLLFVALKSPTFTATTQLLVYVREVQPGPETVVLPGRADVSVVQNQIEVIRSRNVLLKVIDTLNLKNDPEFASNKPGFLQAFRDLLGGAKPDMAEDRMLTNLAFESLRRKTDVRRVGASHTIMIAVTASDPAKTALIANEIAQVYLQERAGVLEGALAKSPLMRERLQGLGPNAYVISPAEPPIRHDGPRSLLIVFASGFLGLGVGAGIAILLDFLDRRIRTSEQAESFFGFECFGIIDRLVHGTTSPGEQRAHNTGQPKPGDLLTWVTQHPNSDLGQTLRQVRAALHGSSVRTIGITSAVHGEGTTTISANLAQLMLLSGKRALLVDCAPGKGSLSQRLARSTQQESEALMEERTSFAAKIAIDKLTGLEVLLLTDAAALFPDSTWHILSKEFIREISESYDLVIFDLPPLSSGAEVRTAAQSIDAFLLVVKWGDTNSELVRRAIRSSGAAEGKFVGLVLNMAENHTFNNLAHSFSLGKQALMKRVGQKSASSSRVTSQL